MFDRSSLTTVLSGQSSGSPYRVRQIMILIKTVKYRKQMHFILYLLVRRAKARQFQPVILCYVQIPSQLFDLRAVCRGNNELFIKL
jgi:hypothetical protein